VLTKLKASSMEVFNQMFVPSALVTFSLGYFYYYDFFSKISFSLGWVESISAFNHIQLLCFDFGYEFIFGQRFIVDIEPIAID
jgi:hypothetical protein